ncbi:protein WHAT'S THIS FACTOR 9, mitochondrial [Cannabis sativa]|uniref:PORR domain-containing protein n=1 Tax=Cannabis sativa TaxID=3483 RepID=A0A803QPD3_CANSA|nr:protein WHAT'S THIS FACTOR 9, mitochondrial [Cannabis sativa]
MNLKPRNPLLSFLISNPSYEPTKLYLLPPYFHQWRGISKVRLKWVKNRSLDHIIDKDTELKAACLLKDAIKRSPTGFLTAKSFTDWQKLLGLTVPVLRFMRRYPTIFHEFPHAQYSNLPCFKLTDTSLLLDSQEQSIHQAHENDAVERLCRLLMMTKTRTLPLKSLYPIKWDLGLPDNFEKLMVPKYPDLFRFIKASNGLNCLRLLQWRDDLAVSALEMSKENSEVGDEYRQFKRGQTTLSFPMSFPRGYGAQKKVREWMEEFQKLPYISPYEDSKNIDPNSDLMEKRVVGLLHEILSVTLHKKTKRNYLRSMREELNLPHKFTRIFTRYPGIFYLSLKCKTTTVSLREGYQRGKLVNKHPLTRVREKFYHVMRTGLLYRGKGEILLPKVGIMLDNGETESELEESEEEEDVDVDGEGEGSEDISDFEDSDEV